MNDRGLALLTVLVLAPAPACDSEGDGDADADGDGGTGILDVTVSVLPAFPAWVPEPVPSATVALDTPGGVRVEASTDADGRVSFEGIDWRAGTAAVTAWAEGYGIMSLVGIEAADGDVTLILPSVGDWVGSAGVVELSGTLAGVTDPTHGFLVGMVLDGGWMNVGDPSWHQTVPVGMPVELVAAEYMHTELPAVRGYDHTFVAWLLETVGPFEANATVDLDFAAAAAEPTTVSGSIALPSRGASPLREGRLEGVVTTWLAGAPDYFGPWAGHFGWASHVERAADGNSFGYDIEFVAPSSVTEVATRLTLRSPEGDSDLVIAGSPTPGAQGCDFLDLPRLTTPASPSSGHPLHEPFEWESLDPAATPLLVVGERDQLWYVSAPPGSTTLTVPEAPRGADVEELLGAEAFRAALALMVYEPGQRCAWRWAQTQWHDVRLR